MGFFSRPTYRNAFAATSQMLPDDQRVNTLKKFIFRAATHDEQDMYPNIMSAIFLNFGANARGYIEYGRRHYIHKLPTATFTGNPVRKRELTEYLAARHGEAVTIVNVRLSSPKTDINFWFEKWHKEHVPNWDLSNQRVPLTLRINKKNQLVTPISNMYVSLYKSDEYRDIWRAWYITGTYEVYDREMGEWSTFYTSGTGHAHDFHSTNSIDFYMARYTIPSRPGETLYFVYNPATKTIPSLNPTKRDMEFNEYAPIAILQTNGSYFNSKPGSASEVTTNRMLKKLNLNGDDLLKDLKKIDSGKASKTDIFIHFAIPLLTNSQASREYLERYLLYLRSYASPPDQPRAFVNMGDVVPNEVRVIEGPGALKKGAVKAFEYRLGWKSIVVDLRELKSVETGVAVGKYRTWTGRANSLGNFTPHIHLLTGLPVHVQPPKDDDNERGGGGENRGAGDWLRDDSGAGDGSAGGGDGDGDGEGDDGGHGDVGGDGEGGGADDNPAGTAAERERGSIFVICYQESSTRARITYATQLRQTYVVDYHSGRYILSAVTAISGDGTLNNFSFPLNIGLFKDLGFQKREEIAQDSLSATVLLTQKDRGKWYQAGWFKIVVIIIVVIIIIVSWGAGGPAAGGLVAALGGGAMGYAAAFVLVVLVSVAASLAFGEKVGGIIGFIVSLFAFGFNPNMFLDFGSMVASQLTPQALIQWVVTIASYGYGYYLDQEAKSLEGEMKHFAENGKEKTERLEAAYDMLGADSDISPEDVTRQGAGMPAVESPRRYFARTTERNPGILLLDMLTNYYDGALALNTDDGENGFVNMYNGIPQRRLA